jgi:hypothetical protein
MKSITINITIDGTTVKNILHCQLSFIVIVTRTIYSNDPTTDATNNATKPLIT